MSTEKMLSGKVALITGGTSGIGEAAALLYAREGAKVVLTGRRAEQGAQVVSAIKKEKGEASFVQGDVSREEDVKRMIAFAVETYGRIDCTFNNAGITGPRKRLDEVELSEWNEVHNTNLTSVFLCMKYQIRQMLQQGGGGVIVNHASLAGVVGMPRASSYTATKHGVVGLTKACALEYVADGIRINAVCTGRTDTPMVRNTRPSGADLSILYGMVPMQRLAQSSEIAEMALWLSSPRASFVTGQAMLVDGGESAGYYPRPGVEAAGFYPKPMK